MNKTIRVTVWNEYRHEQSSAAVREVYPDGIHQAIADPLLKSGFAVRTATLDEPSHGLTDEVLHATDVLIWWGHTAHQEVDDIIVSKIVDRVWNGMGLIVLHSGHFSKVFKRLMGTSCDLKWREAGENERLWVVNPSHPIVDGIGEFIELDHEEMYGEHFDIPTPDELLLVSWFKGGEVFRSGCTFRRGRGKIFYFQPGHETHPTYYHEKIQRVIANAVKWVHSESNHTPIYGKTSAREVLENA